MKWNLLIFSYCCSWATGFSFLIVWSPPSEAAEPKMLATLKGHSDLVAFGLGIG